MTQVPRVQQTDPLLGQVLEGRFRVVDRLGQGGMSAVYRAQQVQGGPDVAVKVLHDELVRDKSQRERFEREARALFGLQHPNVLNVYDYGVVNGLPFLVMELLEGTTLDAMIEHEALDPEVATDIVAQVLTGLAHAHQKGVLHRDIKTENVFVATGPHGERIAKILDFGLVKFVDDDRWGDGKALTAYGEVFGTPAYMSPEQCTGAPADARTDVYSMGVLYFELLTGVWPFMAETRVDMMRAHLTEPPPRLAEARDGLSPRPELEAFVDKALEKDVRDRFADATEMLAALQAIPRPVATVAGQGTPAAGAPTPGGAGYVAGDRTDTTTFPTHEREGGKSLLPYLIVGGALLVGFVIVLAAVLFFVIAR